MCMYDMGFTHLNSGGPLAGSTGLEDRAKGGCAPSPALATLGCDAGGDIVMRVGAAIQMLARGPQDLYLNGNEMTFFSAPTKKWRRHSNFAREFTEEQFPLPCRFGKTSTLQIPRRGDLVGDVHLEITLPVVVPPGYIATLPVATTWSADVGLLIARKVTFELNGMRLSQEERLWYDMSDRVFMGESKRAGLDGMRRSGGGGGGGMSLSSAHSIIVPLRLMCCKGYHTQQSYLPLIAMSRAQLTIEIEWESLVNLLPFGRVLPPGVRGPAGFECKVVVENVWVDEGEKAYLMRSPIFIPYETSQDMEARTYRELEGVTPGSPFSVPVRELSVDLSELNAPVKALVWACYRPVVTTPPFTYEIDLVQSAHITFGSQKRFDLMRGGYFDLLQRYKYCVRSARRDGVGVYSFAIRADAWSPSGSLDFSVLQKPALRLTLKREVPDGTFKVFALVQRFLLIEHGSARLLFH